LCFSQSIFLIRAPKNIYRLYSRKITNSQGAVMANGYKTTWQKGQFMPDAFHAVGCGMVGGVSTPGVIGHAANMTTGQSYDLYENASNVPLFPFLATAQHLQISSASANDTAAGTGARQVTITGLDANYNPLTEVLATSGVTPVVTTNLFLRVNRCFVSSSGTFATTNLGDITVAQQGGTNIQGIIRAGFGIMASGVYTIPAGFSAQMTLIQFSMGGAGAANFGQVARADNGSGAMNLGLRFDINSGFPYEQSIPGQVFLPQKTDMSIRVVSVGQAATEIAGVMNLTVFDNTYLS
jgi:hypothetical protein